MTNELLYRWGEWKYRLGALHDLGHHWLDLEMKPSRWRSVLYHWPFSIYANWRAVRRERIGR